MGTIDKFLSQHTAQPVLNKSAKYEPLPSSELNLTSHVDFLTPEGWFGPGYNTYVKRFNPTGDPEQDQRILDDLRYQNQGYLMRTLNTVPRLVGSLVGYVGESIGVAGGFAADVLVNAADLAKDVKTGREIELKGLNNTFDNFMVSLGADFAEGSKTLFPNYASSDYQDQNFLDRITSTQFILGDFVDGLAFLGSAFVGGTGVLKGIGAVGKLTKGLKVGQAVQKEMALIKAAERAGKKLTAFQKVLKNTPNAMVTAVNTIAESGIEANGVKKELMRSYENGEWGSNLTPKEAEIIATEKASETFKFNVMLLGLTNHLETDMLFGKSTLTKRNVQDALAGKRIVESYIKPKAALNAINESFQEGIQTSIERYETNLVTGRDEVVPRSRYHKQGWLGSTANVLEEFLDGMGNNEQQASMFIGSLIGAGGSYVSSKYREKSLNADFKRLMQNTQVIGDIYNRDYESLFEEEEYEEPVIDPNTKQQVMNGTTPVTQKKKRFKRDANGELVYDQEVIERKLEHLRRDRNLFKEAELARLKGEDEIGDLIRNTHLARLANTWFGLDYGDLILKTKLEKIAAEEAAAAGSSKADNIMLELSKNLDLVDKLKVAYDNIQMEVLNRAKTREEEENFTKDKSAALLYEEAKRMFLRDLSTNNALGTSQTTPIPAAKNNLYNRILSFFNVSTTPATAPATTTTTAPATPATTTAPVVTLQDSVDMAIKDSEEFSKRLLENDGTVYEEWNNLRLERKKIKDPKTSAQAKFNIQKDWQSYRDLMLEEGYFNGNNDSLLQRIRRHTADTLKRNGRLEKALEAKIKNAPTTFELYETAKQLGTFRDLSQKNIQLAENIKAMAERGKNTEKTKIQGDMAAAQLKKTAQEKIIQDLEKAISSNPADRQEKQIIDVDQKLQDYVADTINLYTAADFANIFVYENKDAANNFLEQGVLIQLITGETLVKVLINGELFEERSIPVDIDTLIDVGVINTIFSYHKDQAQDEIDRLDNAIQDLQQEELRVDRELDVLDNLDFTQTSESFRMANLPEDELPAAVKDYLIKQDIERGEEILKTETTNFQNGIYSTTNLKKIIDYLKLLLNYPSLGANEPAVQQLLADLNILFNQMDTAFKKQIAEGKKFTDEHEGSITEYVKDFSTDPNKPVFIEIIDEIKRLHTVKNDPASDPKDIAAAELKLDTKRNELQNLLSNLNIPEILWELKEFLLTNGAEIDEALIEILTRKSTSKNTQPQAVVIRQNRTLVEYSTSYRLFQGVIKGIPYLNTYLISDRIDSSEFAAVINNMKDTDIDFKTPPSAADFATFKANLLRLFEDYKKARRIEKALRFLNSGVDLTAFYQNAPMPAVFPSPQQQVVMEEAVAFLETKETSKIFVIDGAAGTGKTFLLKLFLGARKVFTWSPYTHADANLQATLNIEPSTVTIQSLLNLLNPKNIPANDITAKFNFVVAEINKIKAGTDTNLIAMVEKLEKGTPLIIDEIYAADVDVQIILAVLAETFKAKVIVLGDPNQISNAHGLANYAWQKIAVAAQHGTPLSVRFRSFVLPIAAVQEAFYGKTSKIDELNTVYNDGLGVNGLEDMVKFVKDIKEKLANGVNPNDCKVIVSDDLVKVYNNLLNSQGITVEVLSVEKAQGREFPYVWVDITKMNVNGIVAETAHNKLVYTAVSRGKLYIGYNNADDRPADQRTKIRSSFDASLTEDIGFKQMLFNANERTYLELLQRRNAPSTRPMPAPIVAPTTTTNTPPPVVPLPVAPVAPASPQRTAIVNSALNKGKIVLKFLKKLKTVIANKINNQTPPPATNNTTTNPPPNNQTPPVPPTTNTPIPPTTNTPVPPTTSNQSEIERINTFTREDLKAISDGTGLALKGSEILDSVKVESKLSIGDEVTFYAERERKGVWDGKLVREVGTNNPWGLLGILGDTTGWLRNDSKINAELKALEQPTTSNQSEIEVKKAAIERRRQENPSIERGVLINYESGKTKEQLIDIVSKLKEGKITFDEIYEEFSNLPTSTLLEVKKAFNEGTLADKIQFGLDVNELSEVQSKTRSKEEVIKLRQKALSEKQKAETALKDSEYKIVKKKELITGKVTETKVKRTVEEKAKYEDFYRKTIEDINKQIEEYDAELDALEGNKSTTNDEYKLDYLINKTPIKAGVEELFDSNPELANQVYEALGFNQLITPNDKVVFGHPTIGKSYLKQQGENRFITLDDDYADEVNAFIDANRGSETRQEYKGRKPKEYNEFMLNLFDRLKVQAKKEGKQLFVSNTNILKERMSDFDKVINIPKDEFKKRFDARGATYGFEDWKSDINATIAKVPNNKVINTSGYLSDLFVTPQQKQQALQLYSQYLDTIFPDSKVEEMDDNLYNSVLNQLEQENKIDKDCNGVGKLKAEKGLQTNFTKGGKWEIYEIFEGKSHKQGGIDINIKNNQISFTNKNGSIKAKYGLVISKDS